MQAMEALVKQREEAGRYTDLFDLARRLDTKVINKRQLENLTCAGAFDSLNANRRQVHGGIETLIRYAQAAVAERESGQSSLFGGGAGVTLKVPTCRRSPTGTSLTGWPMNSTPLASTCPLIRWMGSPSRCRGCAW